MHQTIRAHFDGKVIVPDEPVDLPRGELEVTISKVGNSVVDPDERKAALDAFLSRPAPQRPPIPAESLRRENMYSEDR